MEKEKVLAIIDGSNLYHKLKDLEIQSTGKFDYRGLIGWLARDRKVVSVTYYVGAVRTKRSDKKGQQLRKGQQKLFSHLGSQDQGIEVKTGYIMKTDGKYHEKGVDVHMAVDLLIGAYEDLYDTALIVSSDTDLIPAIQKVRQRKKKIEYIGFSHAPSLGLQKHANISRLLIKEEIEKFSTSQPDLPKQP
ncbi:MAG: NYN domain-containing protein [Candidatus Dojkabacteria bacterium]